MTYYRIDSGDALIDLVDREGNLFLDDRFRKDTYTGIRDNAFFFLTPEMKKQVMDTAITPKKSAQVKYSELNVKTDNCGPAYCYIEANDDNTDGEKRLFAAAYGKENPGNGRRFYLLRENVVKAQLRGREGDMFARACYLDNDLNFSADDRDINNAYGGVRGVRRVVAAEGGAAETLGVNFSELFGSQATNYGAMYDAMLKRPEDAVRALNELRAVGMREILKAYERLKK